MKPAVFFDRDGTLIEHVHYLRDAADVRLLPGAGEAVGRLRAAGYACVLVTNQSAIGRGLLTVEGLERIQEELARQLASAGAELDDWRYSPEVPAAEDRRVIEFPDRKPGPGMLLASAEALDLDIAHSWMVGDMISDALAGRNAGCRGTILVRTGSVREIDEADPAVDHVVDDVAQAAQLIVKLDAAMAESQGSES